jgi:hypothetical protein
MLRSSLGTLATERSQLDEISASTAAVQSQLVDLRPLVRRFRQNRLALSAAVDALRPSLSIYRAADAAGGPAAPLDDALHRGEWLVDQLGVDIEVSENHHASGREMLEDVRGAVARGRSELVRQANEFQEDFAKRAERFTVLQTAVIGAVVMFLTAMQSLDYKITFIPPSGQAALLLLLPALALWPGLVAVRLVRQPKGLARRPDSWRARWPELGAAGLVGAAAGWTLDSAVLSRFSWWLQVGEPGQLRLTLVTAGVGLLALPATLVGWTVFRHRRRG